MVKKNWGLPWKVKIMMDVTKRCCESQACLMGNFSMAPLSFSSTPMLLLSLFSGCLSWLLALSASTAISSVLETTVSLSHAFLHVLCLSPDICRRCLLPAEGLWATQTHSWTHLCPICTASQGGLRAGVQIPQPQHGPGIHMDQPVWLFRRYLRLQRT